MLDLRWAWVCAALLGCTSEANEGTGGDAGVDATGQDAAVQDLAAKDAELQDARLEASSDDASRRDAMPLGYVPAPMRSWRDVPAGPAPTPREVCARTWQVPQHPVLFGFGTNPVVRFTQAMVDADGRMLVAGHLLEPFDFGTGLLSTDAQSSAFSLALDGACNLLWAHAYPGSGSVALGLDAERHAVLVTRTGGQDAEGVDLLTLDASGGVLTRKSFSTSGTYVVAASASRDGHVLISSISDGGSASDPRPQRGSNVLLRSDGTVLRQDLLGTANHNLLSRQTLGVNGEILGSGADVEDYYGASLLGLSLAKVSALGTLAWKTELYPLEKATTFDLVEQHVARDGTIAVDALHGDVSDDFAAHHIREVAPDGTSRWEVPITREGNLQVLEVRMGDASVVAYGSLFGPTRVGNTALSVEGTMYRNVLMQLDRGGALRWALTLAESDGVHALDLNARDEVVVAGDGAQFLEGPAPVFVRVYASSALVKTNSISARGAAPKQTLPLSVERAEPYAGVRSSAASDSRTR